jgi:hypothetical protein
VNSKDGKIRANKVKLFRASNAIIPQLMKRLLQSSRVRGWSLRNDIHAAAKHLQSDSGIPF